MQLIYSHSIKFLGTPIWMEAKAVHWGFLGCTPSILDPWLGEHPKKFFKTVKTRRVDHDDKKSPCRKVKWHHFWPQNHWLTLFFQTFFVTIYYQRGGFIHTIPMCSREHPEPQHEWPKLGEIAVGLSNCPRTSAVWAWREQGGIPHWVNANQPCWMSEKCSDGVQYDFRCPKCRKRNFRVCSKCPPVEPRMLKKHQIFPKKL